MLVEFAELGFVLDDFALFYRSVAGLDHDISFEIKNGFEIAQRNIEQVADAAGQALEEPHVRAGRRQLDVAEAFTADFRERDFHAALVADHSAMLHALVFAAEAFPIGYRAKDAGAEQAVALRFESAVVDGLGFGDFAMRPAPDFFRRGQADADGIEIGDGVCQIKRARTKQGVPPLPAAVRRRGRLLKSGRWSSAFSRCSLARQRSLIHSFKSMNRESFFKNSYVVRVGRQRRTANGQRRV